MMAQSNTDARSRAEDYRKAEQGEETPPKPPAKPRNEQAWSDLISQRIEEAMAAGAFDNLSGKGRPVDAAPDPFTPAEMQMANSLLKNNELSPAWISERKEIFAAIATFRSRLAAAKATHDRALNSVKDAEKRAQLEAARQSQIERLRQEMVSLNRRIEIYNLTQPISYLEIYKLILETELP
jgi:DnaJ family protein C protein 28